MSILSIIIPVYNAAAYLRCCIDSIISQTDKRWELILVNDGSTDDSLSIAESYTYDKRIKVISQPNSGPSGARNRGIAAATGDFISFIDSDDWVDSDYVSQLLNHADDADIVFWGLKRIFGDGKCIIAAPKEKFAFSPQGVEETLYSLIENPEKVAYFGFTVTKLFKKSIVEQANLSFNPNLRIKEDELFVWQYCRHIKSIKTLKYAPYNYRILDKSLSHTKNTFANYSLLAQQTAKASEWVKTVSLKSAAMNMVFNYFTGAVIEDIVAGNIEKARSDVEVLLIPHMKHNKSFITLPLWSKIAFLLPSMKAKTTFILNHLIRYTRR